MLWPNRFKPDIFYYTISTRQNSGYRVCINGKLANSTHTDCLLFAWYLRCKAHTLTTQIYANPTGYSCVFIVSYDLDFVEN